MSDRKSLVFTLWLTSALVLLASVLVAPVRTSEAASDASRFDSFRRDFVPGPVRFSTPRATDEVRFVKALASENEEQDRDDALDESRVSFLIPWSFHKLPDRQLIAPPSILSLYPLRC
jgi:hypothetical protein